MNKPDACKGCPGYSTNKGFIKGKRWINHKSLIVLEHPVEKDFIKPYDNGYVWSLKKIAANAGYDISTCDMTYAVKCKPLRPDGKSRGPTETEITECKARYLDDEINTFEGNLIIPSGDISIKAVGHIVGNQINSRGYIFKGTKHKIIPIVSPAFIMEGNQAYSSITTSDFNKIKEEENDRTVTHTEKDYNIYPTIDDIRNQCRKLLQSGEKLSVDIETVGIKPYTCNIICVGVAWSGQSALCIPFLKQHGSLYWENLEDEAEAWAWVYRLLTNPKTTIITQNGITFDMAVFQALAVPFRRFKVPLADTIIKFHTLYLELPHNLNFMSSLFTGKGSFKTQMKESTKDNFMINLPDEQLRTYNLDDCVATYTINDELDKEIAEAGFSDYYNDVIRPLQYIVFDMQSYGIPIDKHRMKELHHKADAALVQMDQYWEELLGQKFNPCSPVQVKKLLNNYLHQAINGTSKLDLVKAIQDEPRLEPIVKGILNYRDFSKMRGTYLQLKTDPDGRIRSSFKLWGTLTWRLASSDPNLQNIPRRIKHGINIKSIFVAPKGKAFCSFDFSQLEARIPAYASRCDKLIKLFDNREDYYLSLACVAFKRPVTDKDSIERFNAKTFKLAEGYGANAWTISNHILKDTYELVDPKYIQTILNRWHEDTPEIHAWHEECYQTALKTGKVYDGFGYSRTLFGKKDDWRQIAYSWPTQTTASGIMNRTMVRIVRSGILEKYGVFLFLQVHDELFFEIPDDINPQFFQDMRELMETPITIFGYNNVVFPISYKVGSTWGNMK